jgi:hypothetical protein
MTKHQRDRKRAPQKTPVVLLAGLPNSIARPVAISIQEKFLPTRVISQASGFDNNNLYRIETVTGLVQAISGYAIRQAKAKQIGVAPANILLAYVPSADDERLLREFDFYVFPLRLTRLAEYSNQGKQFRYDRKVTEEYIGASLETALRNLNLEIMPRLSIPRWTEPLFLPPRNFKVSNTEKMADLFRQMRRGMQPWGDPLPNVRRVKATHEDLPHHIPKGVSKEVCSDYRDLLFPPDKTNHGPQRELDGTASDEERKQFMRSAFRFGVPLINGYHHDVQFAGRKLSGQTFECSREGVVQLNCDYANVYPNDFVRPSE